VFLVTFGTVIANMSMETKKIKYNVQIWTKRIRRRWLRSDPACGRQAWSEHISVCQQADFRL